jgi:hypothetical protein
MDEATQQAELSQRIWATNRAASVVLEISAIGGFLL